MVVDFGGEVDFRGSRGGVVDCGVAGCAVVGCEARGVADFGGEVDFLDADDLREEVVGFGQPSAISFSGFGKSC